MYVSGWHKCSVEWNDHKLQASQVCITVFTFSNAKSEIFNSAYKLGSH